MFKSLPLPAAILAVLALLFLLAPATALAEGLLSTDLDVPELAPPTPAPSQPGTTNQTAQPEPDKGTSFVDNLQKKERTTLEDEDVPDTSFVDNLQQKDRTTLKPKAVPDKSFTKSAQEKYKKKKSTSDSLEVTVDSVVDTSAKRSDDIGSLDDGEFLTVSEDPRDVTVKTFINDVNSLQSSGGSAVTNIGKVSVEGQ